VPAVATRPRRWRITPAGVAPRLRYLPALPEMSYQICINGNQRFPMHVRIQFTDQAIHVSDVSPWDGAGAIVEFRGIVRGVEHGTKIGGLWYEIYEPMAERMVRRIVEELDAEQPCLSVLVVHRHGLVPVGEMAIHVRIEARHRSEAIKMLELFMNRLKTEVPIWKSGSVPC
jgi:molybdopterin synthase catalytic subunit